MIYALGGADQVDGKRNNDRIYGGGGDDRVYGGAGAEVFIFGRGARDLLSGSPGADEIIADEFPDTDPGVDTVKGGRGNDGIDAVDGLKDIIDSRQRPRRLRRFRPEQRRGRGQLREARPRAVCAPEPPERLHQHGGTVGTLRARWAMGLYTWDHKP